MLERRVITSHRSSYPRPISFRQGEALTAVRRDDEYPGWIWVTTEDGNAGWAHESLLDLSDTGAAVAREDYTARELDTEEGERVRSLRELDGWAWVENERRQSGWVPVATLADANA